MIILKIIFLFLAVLYGITVAIRTYYKQTIESSHLLLLSIGIVGFVVLQFNLL